MRIQPQKFRCGKCDYRWTGEIVVDCPVNLYLASLKAIQCPNCDTGTKKIFMERDGAEALNPRICACG